MADGNPPIPFFNAPKARSWQKLLEVRGEFLEFAIGHVAKERPDEDGVPAVPLNLLRSVLDDQYPAKVEPAATDLLQTLHEVGVTQLGGARTVWTERAYIESRSDIQLARENIETIRGYIGEHDEEVPRILHPWGTASIRTVAGRPASSFLIPGPDLEQLLLWRRPTWLVLGYVDDPASWKTSPWLKPMSYEFPDSSYRAVHEKSRALFHEATTEGAVVEAGSRVRLVPTNLGLHEQRLFRVDWEPVAPEPELASPATTATAAASKAAVAK